MNCSGRSVVRSSRLVWDQEVAGSNPAAPTRGMSNHPPFLIQFEPILSPPRRKQLLKAEIEN